MSFFKKLKQDVGTEENRKKESKKPPKKVAITDAKGKKVKSKLKKSESEILSSAGGQLTVDVYQTPSEFVVISPIAGVKPEDIDVSVENDMLTIKGERKVFDEVKEKNYFYQECYWGSFSRQILLPEDVDVQKIKASLQKGVLVVRIPKQSKTRKKKVSVTAAE